jgi:hypothetical protein
MGGTARVSVVVEDRWRAAALVAEIRVRGLEPTCVSTVDEHIGVRTPYSAVLAPIAAAWLRGAIKLPPPGFAIEGRRLRLWMTAAGYRDPLGVTLRMGRCDDSVAVAMQRALGVIGLPSEIVRSAGPGGLGPALRVTGRRRLARFAEVVGDRLAGVPEDAWM